MAAKKAFIRYVDPEKVLRELKERSFNTGSDAETCYHWYDSKKTKARKIWDKFVTKDRWHRFAELMLEMNYCEIHRLMINKEDMQIKESEELHSEEHAKFKEDVKREAVKGAAKCSGSVSLPGEHEKELRKKAVKKATKKLRVRKRKGVKIRTEEELEVMTMINTKPTRNRRLYMVSTDKEDVKIKEGVKNAEDLNNEGLSGVGNEHAKFKEDVEREAVKGAAKCSGSLSLPDICVRKGEDVNREDVETDSSALRFTTRFSSLSDGYSSGRGGGESDVCSNCSISSLMQSNSSLPSGEDDGDMLPL